MTWVKLDDRYATHRKLMAAGAVAIALDVAGMCYAAGHGTDGYIPADSLVAAAPFLSRAKAVQAAAKLVQAGRWEAVEGGWHIHDYLTYNPSAADAEAERQRRAKNTRQWRQRATGDRSPPDRRDSSVTEHISGPRAGADGPAPRGLEKLKEQASLTPPPRDPSPDPDPASVEPAGEPSGAAGSADATPTTRCRHRNDPATCGICSTAVGVAPAARLSEALRRPPQAPDQEASP